MKEIFLSTENEGKIERIKKLLSYIDASLKIYTPKDFKIEVKDVVENGKTLFENAELKARNYFGKVSMPILANDTGFYVEGEGFVDAPKRVALGEIPEDTLTREEIGAKILEFWKGVATKHGGKVDSTWIEAFVLLYPDGRVEKAESRREIILTNQEFGMAHVQMPVRGLYYSKATGKPAMHHTEEEELLEMKPVIDALSKVVLN